VTDSIESIAERGVIACGIERELSLHHRIQAEISRIAGSPTAGCRNSAWLERILVHITRRIAKLQNAGLHGRSWNHRLKGGCVVESPAFVIREEPQTILHDWAAEGSAKTVVDAVGFVQVKKVVGPSVCVQR